MFRYPKQKLLNQAVLKRIKSGNVKDLRINTDEFAPEDRYYIYDEEDPS